MSGKLKGDQHIIIVEERRGQKGKGKKRRGKKGKGKERRGKERRGKKRRGKKRRGKKRRGKKRRGKKMAEEKGREMKERAKEMIEEKGRVHTHGVFIFFIQRNYAWRTVSYIDCSGFGVLHCFHVSSRIMRKELREMNRFSILC